MILRSRRNPRFVFLLLFLAIAFALSSTSHSSPIGFSQDPGETYGYPFDNQLVSTLSGAVAFSTRVPEIISLEVRKDRRHIQHLEGRNKINLRLLRQPHAAPLMFVIAGLGGHSGSGTALMLAETFYDAGYSVVTLPNNMSWQYALSVSESAVPGYMPRDAVEYYQFMKLVSKALTTRHDLVVTSYSVSGFSLGGLLSGFVAREDARQQSLNFEKVVMINPAIDLDFGINVLDSLYESGNGMSRAQKTEKMGMALNLGIDLMEAPLNLNTFQSAAPKLAKLSEVEMRWLIGQTFRQAVRDIIVTGHRVNNKGLLKTPTTKNLQNAQLAEASQFSFADYMNLVVYPTLPSDKQSKRDVLQESSFYALAPYLRTKKNVFVFENADDLIIKKTDLDFLRSTVGPRLKVYPYGGHLGNLWWDQNKRDLSNAVKTAH